MGESHVLASCLFGGRIVKKINRNTDSERSEERAHARESIVSFKTKQNTNKQENSFFGC